MTDILPETFINFSKHGHKDKPGKKKPRHHSSNPFSRIKNRHRRGFTSKQRMSGESNLTNRDENIEFHIKSTDKTEKAKFVSNLQSDGSIESCYRPTKTIQTRIRSSNRDQRINRIFPGLTNNREKYRI